MEVWVGQTHIVVSGVSGIRVAGCPDTLGLSGGWRGGGGVWGVGGERDRIEIEERRERERDGEKREKRKMLKSFRNPTRHTPI